MTSPLDELTDRLRTGVLELTDTNSWRRYLELQSRFHRYSFSNVVLIGTQRSDATLVAGAGTWRRLGRHIRSGEHAIWILAPILVRGARGDDDHGTTVRGFRRVAVFDVTQTEGEPLPTACAPLEGGDPEDLFGALSLAARAIGFSVEDASLPAGVSGDCAYASRRIRVARSCSPAQRVKTLAHELGHALLDHDRVDRPVAELEAESVAYVVCRHLGLDTSGYSFGYVASWAGDGASAADGIKKSCRRIQQAAESVLGLAGVERRGVPAALGGNSIHADAHPC